MGPVGAARLEDAVKIAAIAIEAATRMRDIMLCRYKTTKRRSWGDESEWRGCLYRRALYPPCSDVAEKVPVAETDAVPIGWWF